MGSLGRVGRTRAGILMEQCLYCENTYATSRGAAARKTRSCGDKACVGKAAIRQSGTFLKAKPTHNFEMLKASNDGYIKRYGQPKIFNSPFRKQV